MSANRPPDRKQTVRHYFCWSDQGSLNKPATGKTLLAAVIVLVCAMVFLTHWPALSAEVLSFDDDQYLSDNLLVKNPSWNSARRFLTEVLEPSTVGGYYQPLAMISLMFDYALGGRDDNLMPFHRTSLCLHAANTALIIILLYLLFGRLWIAAGLGLLFGLHPMTVETIPWIGERKTLLAAFFAIWALIVYVQYTRRKNWKLYITCIFLYILALMSKPTSTPLPVLMLLMDYWPLARLKQIRFRALWEKIPFFIIGAISALVTYISQSRTAMTVLPGEHSIMRVFLVLCHNIIFYLYKIVWPVNMSSHYAFPKIVDFSNPMILAGFIGTCILIPVLLLSLRWTPSVLTGWLFFFIAIFPTLGVIGFTNVIASDKFAYLPSVGLLITLAFLLSKFSEKSRQKLKYLLLVFIILILAAAEAVATRCYLSHWQDTIDFYQYMLTMTPQSGPLHYNLAKRLHERRRLSEAAEHYKLSIKYRPTHVKSYNNLGITYKQLGRLDDAIAQYQQSLLINPDQAKAHNNLGTALKLKGRLDDAITHYRTALQIDPASAETYNNLGSVLIEKNQIDEAIACLRTAVTINPRFIHAHVNFANILAATGRRDQAVEHFEIALKLAQNAKNQKLAALIYKSLQSCKKQLP